MILAGTLTLLLIWTCIYMYRYRGYISMYTAVIGTLASSITLGFLIGVVSSFYSDINSGKIMVVIGLTGVLVGALNSIVTIASGVIGGLVSGFAGEMIGSLMPISQGESFLTASMLIFISFHFIFLYLVVIEIPRDYQLVFRKVVQSPYILGVFLIIIFYFYQLIEPMLVSKNTSQTYSPHL